MKVRNLAISLAVVTAGVAGMASLDPNVQASESMTLSPHDLGIKEHQNMTQYLATRREMGTLRASRSRRMTIPVRVGPIPHSTIRHPVHHSITTPTVTSNPQIYALGRLGSTQFGCLQLLWQRESGWNPYATNASSGAYGIPQALPGSKMASAGPDWRTNPITQVKWGLTYIANRYGTACTAMAFQQANHWY